MGNVGFEVGSRSTEIRLFAVTGWWSRGDSNPRDPSGFEGGIQPEFGALFGPNKRIRAGENLFAWIRLSLELSLPFVR